MGFRRWVLLFLFAFLLLSGKTVRATDNYTVQLGDDDASLFVYDNRLQGVALLQVKGKYVSEEIYATKKGIYFFSFEGRKNPPDHYELCRYSFRTKKIKVLCQVPGNLLEVSFHYLYSGLLSFSGYTMEEGSVSFLYNVYTGVLTQIGSGLQITGKYGTYLLLDGNEGVSGAYGAYPLYLYDMASGNSKRLARYVDFYRQDGRYLYLARTNGDIYSLLIPHDILKIDLKTGAKKTLLKGLSCFLIDALDEVRVIYRTERFGETYRYSFSTGKTLEVDDITGLPDSDETESDTLLRSGINLIRQSPKALDYCAEDMDKDGKPELFLEYANQEGEFFFYVYSFNGKKYKKVGRIPGMNQSYAVLASYPGQNGVLCHCVTNGKEIIYCYSLTGGNIQRKKLYSGKVYSAGDIRYYAYNSLAQYNTPINYASEGYLSQYFRQFSDPYVKGSLLLQRCSLDSFVAFREALR